MAAITVICRTQTSAVERILLGITFGQLLRPSDIEEIKFLNAADSISDQCPSFPTCHELDLFYYLLIVIPTYFDTSDIRLSFLFVTVLLPSIPPDATWAQNGVSIAGGHEAGDAFNQLNAPYGLYLDENQTVFIADLHNHRIVEWKGGGRWEWAGKSS